MAEFLNNNIKYLRTIKGVSQQGLAEKVGIDRSTVSRIENNEIETTVDNAIKIADALGVSLYDLVGRDLRTESSYEPTDEDFKQILINKGLMNESEEISDEDFKKLVNFMMANKDFIINKKEEP